MYETGKFTQVTAEMWWCKLHIDSIHRSSLWHILKAYGIPLHIIQIIKSFYHNYTCSVGSSSLNFWVKTGICQGCVMSVVLFNLVTDWVTWHTTEDQPRGIRWTLFDTLEDNDFANNLALVSHTHQHMQEKTWCPSKFGPQAGLQISKRKMELMTLNAVLIITHNCASLMC